MSEDIKLYSETHKCAIMEIDIYIDDKIFERDDCNRTIDSFSVFSTFIIIARGLIFLFPDPQHSILL